MPRRVAKKDDNVLYMRRSRGGKHLAPTRERARGGRDVFPMYGYEFRRGQPFVSQETLIYIHVQYY